jgi:hypothetical protein
LASLGAGSNRTMRAGEMRRTSRSKGADEYAVIAKRMAPTLRRKSAINATGPYGVKKDCRDCRDDQSRAAALGQRRQRHGCEQCVEDGGLTEATRVTRLISSRGPPERFDTKASFLAL